MGRDITEILGDLGITARAVCSDHAPRAGAYVGREGSTFVGKYVKIAFKCRDTHRLEHLYVKVTETYGDDHLKGNVDNDPVLNIGVKCGDEVHFTVAQVEDIYGEPKPNP